ncbi:hypothetical protein [Ruegeria lacuscaerulensis]|uniref:hypothetical protein n=1 Tax=Ruegeria lacuscaerulensis TaxID=55218 RepID=UPI001479CE9F|nr:hypothetical protein [Ruegeria lacuscaerulensis]
MITVALHFAAAIMFALSWLFASTMGQNIANRDKDNTAKISLILSVALGVVAFGLQVIA